MSEPGLFDVEPVPAPPPAEKLSPDRRRTQRQRQVIAAGRHPLSLLFPWVRLWTGTDRTCGDCRFRVLLGHSRTYPKCTAGDGWPRASHGAATDVRAWWPACTDHEYGDPKLSPDAARSGPVVAAASGGGTPAGRTP